MLQCLLNKYAYYKWFLIRGQKWPLSTLALCNRVTALDRSQKLVFAQYLENVWTEFDQTLYTLYHWQDLCLYCKGSFFTNLQQLQPLIDVRNCFLLNILRMDRQNSTKFCIYIIIDMICPLSVLQTELCSWTYLCPLIVLCRGYG